MAEEQIEEEIQEQVLAKIEIETEETSLVVQDGEEVETVRIQDEHYIQNEYRMGVEMINTVAETLRGDLNQGARASSFEAFSSLMKERREILQH